mmetsp:Transcript_28579/g.72830  ORF Transcript_28579/g.72830 Transcript_28579/m.72830 type:complete len:108 (+) Transcript_28579:3390-3713(+)
MGTAAAALVPECRQECSEAAISAKRNRQDDHIVIGLSSSRHFATGTFPAFARAYSSGAPRPTLFCFLPFPFSSLTTLQKSLATLPTAAYAKSHHHTADRTLRLPCSC